MVLPAGFEPASPRLRTEHPWPLDDGSMSIFSPYSAVKKIYITSVSAV